MLDKNQQAYLVIIVISSIVLIFCTMYFRCNSC